MDKYKAGEIFVDGGMELMRVYPTPAIMKGTVKQVVDEGRCFAVNLRTGYLTIRARETKIDPTVKIMLCSTVSDAYIKLPLDKELARSMIEALFGTRGWGAVWFRCKSDETKIARVSTNIYVCAEALAEFDKIWEAYQV